MREFLRQFLNLFELVGGLAGFAALFMLLAGWQR